VKRFRDQKGERYLSAVELARLGDALGRDGEYPFATAGLRLLILTGARKSEIQTAKWEHVDFERSCLRLPDSKTGAKTIPLGAAALDLLQDLPRVEGNPYILPGYNNGGYYVGLPKAWLRVRKAARLEGVRLHDLRHSFASVAASAGDSLLLIGAILGHRDSKTTQRYAHLSNDPVKAAADRTADRIAAAMADGIGRSRPTSQEVSLMTRTPLVNGLILRDGAAEMREARHLFGSDVIERLKTKLPDFKSPQAESQFTEAIIRWAAGYLEVKHRWQTTAKERSTRRLQVADKAAALTDALEQLDSVDRVALIENLPRGAVPIPEASATISIASWGVVAGEIIDSRGPMADQLHLKEDGVVSIQESAALAAEIALPKAGRPTPLQHMTAVISLCCIYEAATGLKPTRRWKPNVPGGPSVPYGPFREFAMAALTPLEGAEAKRGIDERIKDALRSRKRG
jgi:hypothetical protein